MSNKQKTLKVRQSFRYKDSHDEYVLRLRRRNWWWLLCLLPLLLLIRCEKDITVQTVSETSEYYIPEIPVKLQYESYALFRNGNIIDQQHIELEQCTDSAGLTIFRDLPCSVFSYIFQILGKVDFSVNDFCYELSDPPCQYFFHFTNYAEVPLKLRTEDIPLHVIDLEDNSPIANARLTYIFTKNGAKDTGTVVTLPNGEAIVPDFWRCGLIEEIHASCYGYIDTIANNLAAAELLLEEEAGIIRMRPVKDRFTFFVKNKESKEAIVGATVEVRLTHPISEKTMTGTTMTRIDGVGIGVYNDAFVLAQLALHASAPRYKDNDFPYSITVDTFIALPDEERVIYLEPLPFTLEYQNVDSITGEPIEGVKNHIKVFDYSGNYVYEDDQISGPNGYFPVEAKEGYKIEIVSQKDPYYKLKNSIIASHDKAEVIKMTPILYDITFRTVNARDKAILANCDLNVHTSKTNISSPTNSNKGTFIVKGLRLDEEITITAAKTGYTTNDYTIQHKIVYNLYKGSQSDRDIPLKLLPFSYSNHDAPPVPTTKCYDLKQENRTFLFEWDVCSVCTMLIVTDSDGNELGRFGIDSPEGNSVGIRHTPPMGFQMLTCPTQEVCVTIVSVNADRANFKISCN